MALCCKKTLAALTAALMLAAPAWAETVLKVVPHADLKVLDPVWTTAFVTRHHGYMIYDTLFGLTQKGEIKPQLVDTYTCLLYTRRRPTICITASRCVKG